MAYFKLLNLRRIIKSFSIVIILMDLLVPHFETRNQIERTFIPYLVIRYIYDLSSILFIYYLFIFHSRRQKIHLLLLIP